MKRLKRKLNRVEFSRNREKAADYDKFLKKKKEARKQKNKFS